jgi:phage/plasmid-associated DNA primase
MYQPFCKLVFCLNNLPYSKDKSWGFQRRLVVIPFNKIFRDDDPDTQNYAELRASLLSETDGIFNWALIGLNRLRENKYKFSNSEAVNEALEDYKTEVNPYYNFVKERLEQGDESDMITNETLVNLLKEWAAKNGHKNLASASNQKIAREVRHVLMDAKIDITYGDNVKSGGKRSTQKVRLKKGERVISERVA